MGTGKNAGLRWANTGFTVFVHLLYIVYAKNREPETRWTEKKSKNTDCETFLL